MRSVVRQEARFIHIIHILWFLEIPESFHNVGKPVCQPSITKPLSSGTWKSPGLQTTRIKRLIKKVRNQSILANHFIFSTSVRVGSLRYVLSSPLPAPFVPYSVPNCTVDGQSCPQKCTFLCWVSLILISEVFHLLHSVLIRF